MEFSEEGKISESHLILLLQVIYVGKDIGSLLKRGLQYSQIAELIDEVAKRGFVEEREEKLIVTALGLSKLKEDKTYNLSKNADWIRPLDEYRIDKICVNSVYLPNTLSVYEIAESLASSGTPRNDESSF